MRLTEFGLIERYFRGIGATLASTVLGVGDDCAVLRPPVGELLLATTDTLVEDVHFFAGTDPESLGYKALAVNLSDLAAMGATPRWVTLALTMPEAQESWIEAFARGFSDLARRYDVQLVGGDTTRGALTIGVQALGSASEDRILYRSKARPGDRIYVTGTIGDAGLALKYLQDFNDACPPALRRRLERPDPRIEVGRSIGGLASACIDISDGFTADLSHLLQASRVGATVDWNRIPLSSTMRDYVDQTRDFSLPLCAGDDYELCFTVSAEKEAELIRQIGSMPYSCRPVGTIDQQPGLRVTNGDSLLDLKQHGYEHFS